MSDCPLGIDCDDPGCDLLHVRPYDEDDGPEGIDAMEDDR